MSMEQFLSSLPLFWDCRFSRSAGQSTLTTSLNTLSRPGEGVHTPACENRQSHFSVREGHGVWHGSAAHPARMKIFLSPLPLLRGRG